MKIITEKKFKFFVGIDVSKDFFDATLMSGQEIISHQIILNNEAAIKVFLSDLKNISGFKPPPMHIWNGTHWNLL